MVRRVKVSATTTATTSPQPADPQYFAGQVSPSTLSPGEGKPESPRPLRQKSVKRTEDILEQALKILSGEKVELEGKGLGQRWLSLQIDHMCEKGVLTAPFDAYVTRPEKKKVIGFNPSYYKLSEGSKYLADRLDKEWAPYIHTCGTKVSLRQDFEIDRIHRASRIMYAPPGDLNSLYDMMKLVNEKLHGRLLNKPLIIENSDNYWTNLMTGFKAVYKYYNGKPDSPKYVNFDDFAHHHGIYVTETKDRSLSLIKTLYPKTKKPIDSMPVNSILPKDAVIFVATGTKKKYTELENIFLAQGYKVRLLPIDALVTEYVSPDEVSGTYEGNAKEKVDAGIGAWEHMSASQQIRQIKFLNKEYGLKLSEENMFILAEDSGFHFLQPNVGNDPIFNDMRDKMDSTGPFPGVETGPIGSGSLGIKRFMKQVQSVFEKKGWTDTRVLSTSVLALAPIKRGLRNDIKIAMTAGVMPGKVRWEAEPQDGDISLDHYIMPDGFNDATCRQIGPDYEKFHSARAKAWMALAHEADITAQPGAAVEKLKSKSFIAGIISDGTAAKQEKLAGQIVGKGFGAAALSPKFNTLGDVEKQLFSKADAFVLAFDPKRAEEDFWRNLYIFTSLLVGEQTRDKYVLNKPIKLLNPDGAFDGLVQMVNDFHAMGTVKEFPKDLFHEVKSVDSAVAELEENRKSYLRYQPPELKTHEEGYDSPKGFNVAIFCSATNESGHLTSSAASLAEELCKRNFGIVTGAGGVAMMGAITDKVDELRHAGTMEEPPHHTGATVYHLMHKEATKRGVIQKLTITPSIYERMEVMIKASQAFVIMPGGTGTIQELAALVMLKQRAVSNPSDHYAVNLMKGKEIVIYNCPVGTDHKGFYDDFLKHIPKEDYKKLGIHVYTREEDVLKKMDELHAQAASQNEQPSQGRAQERPRVAAGRR